MLPELTVDSEWLRSLRKEPALSQSHPPCFHRARGEALRPSQEHHRDECKDSVVLSSQVTLGFSSGDQSLWLTEKMKLSWGNSTLTTDPARRVDAGALSA